MHEYDDRLWSAILTKPYSTANRLKNTVFLLNSVNESLLISENAHGEHSRW